MDEGQNYTGETAKYFKPSAPFMFLSAENLQGK
jgi:hypothetical protein